MGRLLFVLVFFALTLLPGLQMLTDAVPEQAVDENRNLAPAPSSATPAALVPRVADRWFADHFALRSLLIRTKTQIDFSVFGLSDRVLIGKDGQLFYRSTVNAEEPAMQQLLATQEDVAAQGFSRFAQALARAGIHLALVVNMMSDRFYPELLPASAVPRPAKPLIDDFVARLRALPDVTFVDSTALLGQTMQSRRIFHRTDFHWNDPAAFVVGKDLVDQMSAREGRPASAWTHPLLIEARRTSGGIAMFMPLFVPPAETALFVKQSWDWPAGFTQAVDQGIFEHVTKATPDPRLLPPTVFVGDSFLDGMMRSGLQADFVATERIRWRPDLRISDIAAALPPGTRWIVIQFIEINQPAVKAFAERDDVAKAVGIIAARSPAPPPRPAEAN